MTFKLPSSIPVLYTCPTSKSKLTVAQVKVDGVITPMYRFSDIVTAMGYINIKDAMAKFLAQEAEVCESHTSAHADGGQSYMGDLPIQLEADIQAIPTTKIITEAQAAPVIEVANSGCKVTTLVKRGPNLALKFAWKGEGMTQRRQTIFINQPLLFKFVSKSNMPSARPFQDWLFGELLPVVMRDGYNISLWANTRLAGIDTRKAFTSAIKVGIEDGRFNDTAYSHLTALVNKAALGAESANRDQLTDEELNRLKDIEYSSRTLLSVSESEEDFEAKLALFLKRNK